MSSQVLIARVVPGDADAGVVGDAAEPGELGAVERRACVASSGATADGCARRCRRRCRPWRRPRRCRLAARDAAGARHVLRHDGRLARNVLAEMARQQPPIEVVAAADAVADDERDGLAACRSPRRLRRWRMAAKCRARAATRDCERFVRVIAAGRPGESWLIACALVDRLASVWIPAGAASAALSGMTGCMRSPEHAMTESSGILTSSGKYAGTWP